MLQKLDNWVYNVLEKTNKHITKLLKQKEHRHYVRYINKRVAELDFDEKKKPAITQLALNALNTRHQINSLSTIPPKACIDITINTFVNLYNTLGRLVSIQPIKSVVDQIFFFKYKVEDPDAEPRFGFPNTSHTSNLTLQLMSGAIEAKTHPTEIKMTEDSLEGDLYDGLLKTIEYELVHEVVAMIVSDLERNAKSVDFSFKSMSEATPSFVGDVLGDLMNKISEQFNEALKDSMMVGRKYIIASPLMISLLQVGSNGRFKASTENHGFSSLTHAGTIDDVDVYCYLWPLESLAAGEDTILLGSKSDKTEFYAGYIYSPFCLAQATGKYVDSNSFNVVSGLGLRHGTQLINSDMFRVIKVKNLTFE